MRIMVTGASGQLGSELVRQLAHGSCELGALPEYYRNAEVHAVDLPEFDLRDPRSIHAAVERIRPDLVFHCAAYTAVDACEDDPDLAMRINAEGTRCLAQACERHNARLVYISTDYVFAGNGDTPYQEEDPCDPCSVYGESKYQGELYAVQACTKTIVVRTAWMYGVRGKNFVKIILAKAASGASLRVVSDQIGCPSNAEDVAYCILRLAETVQSGIYHCAGDGQCSWYEFAAAIVQEAGIPCVVEPCATEDYPVRATRPKYSVLAQDKLHKQIGLRPRPWQTALKQYINKLEDLT